MLATKIISHGEEARLDLALLLVLRVGVVFVARHDLRRNQRPVLDQLRWNQFRNFPSLSMPLIDVLPV